MDTMRDVWKYLRVRKKFWLMPAVITLILVALIVSFSSALVVPAVYTFF